MEPKDFTDSQTREDAATAIEALGALLLPLLQDEAQRHEALRLLTALQWRMGETALQLLSIEDSLERINGRLGQAGL